ncbi:hypothetical protein [Cupriavidus pauculus]|uniref:hypothetical protein n=1 Tax=Cupriavidus pauculus TaxID=82633 RepID=UPI000783130E|nr:hypothetical protein [Cupriavidus pauculus]MBY4732505.1 hypothetical protein [Cupriavidus pauculus]MCM3604584.1 hypothetical protein [Cupriavidus pauculus]UAK98629.1 hypothetical protein K8O84_11425 [Cupriavidus pauculus]
MMARVRGAFALAAFVLPLAVPAGLPLAGAAHAAARAAAAPAPQALYLPADLTNICEADSQALQQAITRHWRPSLNAIDQWTQLVRSFSCDLSGSRDIGWHRVPLRAYESAIRYPLQWVEWEEHNGRPRRSVRTYYSASQLPQKIDFFVGGRIDEIRYDRRAQRIDARFPAAGSRGASGAVAQCAYTTLQFRQQNGLWLLSGVEPNLAPRC